MTLNKKFLFQNLSKIQKSSLISYLKSFISKKKSFDTFFLYEKFLEEQEYYIEIKKPYFCFIEENLKNDMFLKDLKICIKDICFQKEQKEKQKPYLEKQKEFNKEQRKKAQKYKMSKEPPTQKQLSYYKSLCKKQNLQPQNLENLSKLDLKNMIETLLND